MRPKMITTNVQPIQIARPSVTHDTLNAEQNEASKSPSTKKLYTIMTGHSIASGSNNSKYKMAICKYVKTFNGIVLECNANAFVVLFESASKAVYCSLNIQAICKVLNAALNISLDIKDCSPEDAIHENSYNATVALLQTAVPYQIVLSQTVTTVLGSTHFKFKPYKTAFVSKDDRPTLFYSIIKCATINTLRTTEAINTGSSNNVFLNKVTQIVGCHLSDDGFGVKALSQHIGISERQLQRKLKAIVGQSPNTFIAMLRLKQAKVLLKNTNDSSSEIAFHIGFSNPSYFSKCFKNAFKMSPTTYRQRHKNA